MAQQRPLLMFHERGSGEYSFYDRVGDSLWNMENSNLEGARFLGSTLGWLLMTDSGDEVPSQEHETFIYNPRLALRSQLPSLTVGNHLPPCVVRYGVLSGDPGEDGTYACLIVDNFIRENFRVLQVMAIPLLRLYYVRRINGQWSEDWISTPIENANIQQVNSICPYADGVSIRTTGHTHYDFNFETEEWDVQENQEDNPIEWNPFEGLSFSQVKQNLGLPPQVPTTLSFIGTTTNNETVKNYIKMSSRVSSASSIDGVWIKYQG